MSIVYVFEGKVIRYGGEGISLPSKGVPREVKEAPR
jgi:hypothetical protein